MIARELISSVPALHPSDTGTKALRLMNEYHLTQLPMVADNKYLALVAEDDILDMENQDAPLQSLEPNGTRPAIMEYAHFYEALKLRLQAIRIADRFQRRRIPWHHHKRYFAGCAGRL